MKTGYKSFEKGMICKGKEYKEHTTYEEDGNDICESGAMDYFEDPFDVLDYYPLVDNNGDFSEFAQVESLGDDLIRGHKSVANKLHIREKLSFTSFIKACVDFILEKTKIDQRRITIADIRTSDDCVKINSSKDSAKIVSSGNSAKIVSSGYYVQIGSSGDYAQISSSGDYAQISSSGEFAKISSDGKSAVVSATGINSMAKAKIGSWITLAEWVQDEEVGNYIPKCVKTEYVDGAKIKEDTFYKLIDGEFKEI